MIVLLTLHSFVSYASYRIFTVSDKQPSEEVPYDNASPLQKTSADNVVHINIKRTFTPMPVIFYICAGYVGLFACVIFMLYIRLRAL